MHTATMIYKVKPAYREAFVSYWSEQVLTKAEGQPGLHRMMLLESEDELMAFGSWEDPSYAQEFMKTGVFKELMDHVSDWLVETPSPKIWDLRHFI